MHLSAFAKFQSEMNPQVGKGSNYPDSKDPDKANFTERKFPRRGMMYVKSWIGESEKNVKGRFFKFAYHPGSLSYSINGIAGKINMK